MVHYVFCELQISLVIYSDEYYDILKFNILFKNVSNIFVRICMTLNSTLTRTHFLPVHPGAVGIVYSRTRFFHSSLNISPVSNSDCKSGVLLHFRTLSYYGIHLKIHQDIFERLLHNCSAVITAKKSLLK